MNTNFHFLNHSSFVLVRKSTAFLVDPWLQGTAFNDYWRLQSDETSNEKFFSFIKSKNIDTLFIWLSHEHSDHFSVPFLMSLKKETWIKKITFIMFDFKDGRVKDFVKKQGFKFISIKTGSNFKIEENFFVRGGIVNRDSFIRISIDGFNLLNINDCPAHSLPEMNHINSFLKDNLKIHMLASQFGYASWLGNQQDVKKRTNESKGYLNSLVKQVNFFNAEYYLPIASFSYFAKKENFYLNKEQNYIGSKNWDKLLNSIESQIIYLKPFDRLSLKSPKIAQNEIEKFENKSYWKNLFLSLKPQDESKPSTHNIKETLDTGQKYIENINKRFLFTPRFLSKRHNYTEIKFYIKDLKTAVCVSYVKGCYISSNDNIDISINSKDFNFLLQREFGFDTIYIGGALEIFGSIHRIVSFFNFQVYEREGLGVKRPFFTLYYFLKRKFITKEVSEIPID